MDQHREEDVPGRRIHDETLEMLQKHIDVDEELQGKMLKELSAIRETTGTMLEMLRVYKNIKGWGIVTGWGIVFILGLASFVGAVTAIGYAFKQWVRGS